MKNMLKLMAMSTIMALLSNCGGSETARTAPTPTPAPANKLAIAGSTTLLPVAQKAAEAFQKRYPEIKVSINGGGSLIGINGLVDGINDIAMSSRELKEAEKEKCRKRRITVKENIVAWDGIVPIVHPSNPIKNLTMAQLKDIYTGKVTDWQQVGGKKGGIVVVSRDFTSGTHEDWAELVLNNEHVASNAQVKSSSAAVLEMIAGTPNAIGYEGLGYIEGNNRVKPLSVNGKSASADTILDKSYQVVRPLHMFTRDNATTAVIDFLNFMMSPEGQALVKEAKFVPVLQPTGK